VRCLILRISGCGGQECVGFPIFACGSVLFESLSLSLSLCPRFFVVAAAGTNHKGQIGSSNRREKTRQEER
jgi:hypothetical protein